MLYEFEYQLFKSQLEHEETVVKLATTRDKIERNKPCVIFYDRALGDMKAYMPSTMWSDILSSFKMNEKDLVSRYDLVIHLVTAADGAIDFYTKSNNTARTETPAEAIDNDRKVRDAWASIHHNVAVIPNGGFTKYFNIFT